MLAALWPRSLPLDLYDRARTADEARRARRLEGIYHAGQHKIWDGREMLEALLREHGGVHIEAPKRQSLAHLYSIIMWGELAAWRISAQLADLLESTEARLAATSQAHDEARHFYVLHDYLTALGEPISPPPYWSRVLLELPLREQDLARKIAGMQIQVETIALALFTHTRLAQLEPVLCGLMPYFERDEARHVGLGAQYLPELLRKKSRAGIVRFAGFQLEILACALMSTQGLEPHLRVLGLDPRALVIEGARKQVPVLDSLQRELGVARAEHTFGALAFDVMAEAALPEGGRRGLYGRARQAAEVALGRRPGITAPIYGAVREPAPLDA